jgi:hypothetical protein
MNAGASHADTGGAGLRGKREGIHGASAALMAAHDQIVMTGPSYSPVVAFTASMLSAPST